MEKGLGAKPSPARLQQTVISVLKKLIKQHKRVLFDGDNYAEEWHEEAERRGLPNLRDSVAAFDVLRSRKNVDLFRKYGVLNKAEYGSRIHIAVEKYVKQLTIEADTMVQMARIQILPASLKHQTLLAQAVSTLEGAGVKSADQLQALKDFVMLVGKFRDATMALEKELAHHDDDPFEHAAHIQKKVRPAMAKLREYGDQLETTVSADVWPLPTYQELLFLR